MKKIIISFLLVLTACAGTTNIHGSLIKPEDIDRLRIGVHDQRDVVMILGTPSTMTTLGGNVWYYITDTIKSEPLKKPYLIKRQIVGLEFTKEGKLDRIFDQDETVSKDFYPSEDTTPTESKPYTYQDQIMESINKGN